MNPSFDYLKWNENPQLSRRLCSPTEVILYSKHVQKVNKRSSVQNRILVITHTYIYNFKSTLFTNFKLIWTIETSQIEGFSLTYDDGEFLLMLSEHEKSDYLYRANAVEVLTVLKGIHPDLTVIRTDITSLQTLRRRKSQHRTWKLDLFRCPSEEAEAESEAKEVVFAVGKGVSVRKLQEYVRVSVRDSNLGAIVIKVHSLAKYMYYLQVEKPCLLEKVLKENELREIYGPLQFIVSSPTHFSIYYDYSHLSSILRISAAMSLPDRKNFIRKVANDLIVALDKFHQQELVYGLLTPMHIHLEANKACLYPPGNYHPGLSISVNDFEFAEYMAPEVHLHGEYWKMSDWWSLGVILWEMALNKHPFLDAPDMLEAIREAECPALPEEMNEIKPLLTRLVCPSPRPAIEPVDLLTGPCLQLYRLAPDLSRPTPASSAQFFTA